MMTNTAPRARFDHLQGAMDVLGPVSAVLAARQNVAKSVFVLGLRDQDSSLLIAALGAD